MSNLEFKTMVFNRVKTHLLKQRQKCTIDSDCMYRGDNGKMCAVGCLIDDERYDEVIEGNNINSGNQAVTIMQMVADSLNVPVSLVEYNLDFLSTLQKIHDNYPVNMWEDSLNKLATRFGVIL